MRITNPPPKTSSTGKPYIKRPPEEPNVIQYPSIRKWITSLFKKKVKNENEFDKFKNDNAWSQIIVNPPKSKETRILLDLVHQSEKYRYNKLLYKSYLHIIAETANDFCTKANTENNEKY